ncbi:MAG: GatB/YqeY domain-containing protein [Halobacteriovoraceae bacterium]|jgi:uncharacterized protein|nr:GatB/YqeY domain-containing protein [Halobacteriovoraceae bacterium]MBT5093169.1 GatB/YqeY domain-containing protein [Halobacteriovoraceae bacterium]
MKDRVSKEIMAAMKAKDKPRLNVLRYLKKLFIENDTSKKPIAEMEIVISYAKKVKDSLSLYPEGSPQAEEIKVEVEILAEYLPEQMDQEKVIQIISDIVSGLDSPNMGAVMKELSPQIKGKFDGKLASQLVLAALKS